MKQKEDLINIHFSVAVMYPKGVKIIFTCGKDNITGVQEEYKAI